MDWQEYGITAQSFRSWLMDLTERAFSKDANLEQIKGTMHSSGEGKWTVETVLDL